MKSYILALLCIAVGLFPTSAIAEVHTVTLIDFMFVPMDLTVREGDSVRWVWTTDNHNVVSGLPFGTDGAFQSTVENTGFEYEVLFDREVLNNIRVTNNKYEYYCSPHVTDNMFGSVTVLRDPKNFAANPRGWQQFPPVETNESSDCTAILDADETQLTIQCSHSVANITAVELRRGTIKNTGPVVCAFSQSDFSQAVCPLSTDEIDPLFNGEFYIQVSTSEAPSGLIRGQVFETGKTATVRGSVYTAKGQGIANALVTIDTSSTNTDSNGNYQLTAVPYGVYQPTATKGNLYIVPNRETSPLLINSPTIISRTFSEVAEGTCGPDGDGDGVCDAEEAAAGSNINDRGSYPDELKSPIRSLWNGFLDMVNVLELINTSFEDLPVTLRLYNIFGQEVHTMGLTIAARAQRDVVLNGVPGFEANAYGIVSIEFPEDRTGDLDGRLFFYRPDGFGGYEFAFGVPYTRPLFGPSSVAFNTYQPSLNPADASSLVAQWLSVANLSSQSSKDFTIEKYNQSGQLLDTQTISVPPFGRSDLGAGHNNPGPNTVGLIRVLPEDPIAPYFALLSRYGGNVPAGFAPTNYNFAFVLLAKDGNGEKQHAPISVGSGASNWLELINTRNEIVKVTLSFYDNAGTLLNSQQADLGPYAQQHFNAGEFLPAEQAGIVEVSADKANSVVGQSMFYFRDASNGSIQAMYGSSLRESLPSSIFGSYNLYIGMLNWLKLTNIGDTTQTFTLTVYPPGRTPVVEQHELVPNAGIDLGLHDTARFGTQLDEFSLFTIDGIEKKSIFSELLRLRPAANGIDFTAPTPVR